MYHVLFYAARICPHLPVSVRRFAAILIGTAAWAVARKARRVVTANVRQVLAWSARGESRPAGAEQRIVRGIFRNCIDNYLELLALPGISRRELVDALDVTGVEHFEEALALGRGVVLFSAHLGPFEHLSAWFAEHGHTMTIPVEKTADPDILRLIVDLRRSKGIEFVALDGFGPTRKLLEALRKNQLVLITADRAIAGRSADSMFFGAPAQMPLGPVDLALRTGAPLVGAFGWRSRAGRVGGEFTRLSLALPEDRRTDRDALQAELIRHLERLIGAHLEQWVVFQPIWRNA